MSAEDVACSADTHIQIQDSSGSEDPSDVKGDAMI